MAHNQVNVVSMVTSILYQMQSIPAFPKHCSVKVKPLSVARVTATDVPSLILFISLCFHVSWISLYLEGKTAADYMYF